MSSFNRKNFDQIKMDSDNKEKIYSPDDVDYRIYFQVTDKLAINRYNNNHLKSQTQVKNIEKDNHKKYKKFIVTFLIKLLY